MSKKVTYRVKATTEDSGDPVLRVTSGESYMDVILDTEHKSINVWFVESAEKGDMKRMLDDIVQQLPTNRILFLAPLEEEAKEVANEVYAEYNLPGFEGGNIRDALDGFEEKTLDFDGRDVHVLEGRWKQEEEVDS